ncbi:type III pantothenate kinase [Mycoplasma hafezii]|uniref:type III pantothenate kinase n=1 Tax=Mycoplasma hafezii TaxID=525886 RepID=UPI003CE8F691
MQQKIIVLDVGNTTVDLGIFDAQQNLHSAKKFNYSQLENELLYFLATELDFNSILVIGYVNFSAYKIIMNHITKFFQNIYVINDVRDWEFGLNPQIKIDEVGIDILASTEYAVSQGYFNSIIYLLGSANVAIKIKNSILQGAVITPGLQNTFNGLIDNIYNLQNLKFDSVMTTDITNLIFGTNTNQAIKIGLIRQLNSFVADFYDDNSKIFITGGNAKFLNKEYTVYQDSFFVIKAYLNTFLKRKG